MNELYGGKRSKAFVFGPLKSSSE